LIQDLRLPSGNTCTACHRRCEDPGLKTREDDLVNKHFDKILNGNSVLGERMVAQDQIPLDGRRSKIRKMIKRERSRFF
jgi:hypothetical protein